MSLSGAAGGIVAGLALTGTSYGVLAGAAAVLVLPLLAAVFVSRRGDQQERHGHGRQDAAWAATFAR